MKYDAFISYRHGELDGLVAEKLHRLLETYRIPRTIAKKTGKKKLSRIFRDRDELPTSSNLSDSINEALENSSYLLLICSKRTCKSLWVMREVERFGELHGKDKIITLLIDGEPDESFPPGLREREINGETIFVEPLAADIRAETWKGSINLLKEEKLRLLSPILGCAFDDLRRRHRRRRIQRITTVLCAAFAFMLAFGSFSTYQYLQIHRQMQLKLENQSRVLAQFSANELAAGDPEIAKLLALSALPNNLSRPERPFVAAAQKALADALGVYDVSDGFKSFRAITLPAPPGRMLLSPDENYIVVLYPYELAVYDLNNGNLIATLNTIESTLADIRFLADDIVVFAGESGLQAYHIGRAETLWEASTATSIAVSENGTVIAAVYKDDSRVCIYNTDGIEIATIGFEGKTIPVPADDSFVHTNNTLFELNYDGTLLAVSFLDGSLWVYNIPDNKATEVNPAGRAFHYQGGFSGKALVYSHVEREPYNAVFEVYDTEADSIIQRLVSEISHFTVFTENGAFFAHEQRIYSVDTTNGEINLVATANGRISSFSRFGDTFLIGENDGTYQFSFAEGDARVFSSGHISHLTALGKEFALTGSHDSVTIRILKNIEMSHTVILSYDSSYPFSEAKINPDIDRAVFYSYRGMRVVDLNGNIVAETQFPDSAFVIDTQYDKMTGNVVVLYDGMYRTYSGFDGSLLSESQGISALATEEFDPAKFPFVSEVRGKAEVFYSGNYIFIAPLNGNAMAYTTEGTLIRTFSENGYFCEAGVLADYITVDYISATDGRYTLLLKPDTLETVAVLPRFLGELPANDSNIMLVLDDGKSSLRTVPLLSTQQLIDLARERLNGREMTTDEIRAFNAG